MEKKVRREKKVTVFLTPREHERLVCMANCADRTAAGYLRWLLLRHLKEQDQAKL